MTKKQSKTALVRKQIEEFLEKKNGEWVRQKDIVEALLPDNPYGVKVGTFNGIFGKHIGTGGIYVPILNVEIKKEGHRAYYRYLKPDEIRFSVDHPLHKLAQKVLEFEKELNEGQLFNIDLRQLNLMEVNIYLEFINGFEDLKNKLVKGDN